jgi:hypothetical protein
MLPSIDAHLIETLTVNSVQLHLYFSSFIFFFGIIGNILNILVLSQRTLRSNSCIFLFLISSIANLISILFGLTSRILSSLELDLTETNDILCKLRAFIAFTSRTIALWLIMLATIDRWMTSSNNIHRRRYSSLKNAQKGSIIITIISILCYSQMLYCYKSNLLNTPLKCYGKTSSCRLLTDITYTCFTISLPVILMTIFGLMTISNIRQIRICMEPRKVPSNKHINKEILLFSKQQKQRWKKLERYLRRMLLLQVILLILLTLPQTIHKLYFTITSLHKPKSSIEYDFGRFLYKFELLLPYLASALPFYIYTLAGGNVFRQTLRKLIFCSR